MSDDKEDPDSRLCVALVLLGLSMGFSFGGCFASHVEQQKAVEAEVGRWTIDPKTGRNQFVYGKE